MKKSKFLQSSKDMISRSFNPTKCKTSLRLAASRLKLLRNKKEVQAKQMRREIAQLLESGQDQTARIRVEHVIREEKLMAAYDLLEIYCELTVARLPIIETQKDCPIDLKEAITSIVFASPRCGDVPELLDVRKQFSAKYGKDFVSAAIELRPQCGVSRLLVEKLSATAPDGQTKIKILNAIAEEHNVKWDPKSFEEKHAGGPSSIKKENELYSDPPHFNDALVQARPINNSNSSPLVSVQKHDKISMEPGDLPTAPPSGTSTNIEPKPGSAGEELPQSFQRKTHNGHLDGQRWKMEFKDAASAAQAAAESAEQASIAARAAAELSSHGRILGQYSAESYKSDAYTLKDHGLERPSNLNSYGRVSEASENKVPSEYTRLRNEQIDRSKPSNSVTPIASENKVSSEYTRLINEQIDRSKPSNAVTPTRSDVGGIDGSEEYSQAVSLKSKASADGNSLYHSFPSLHDYTQENSLKDVYEGEVVNEPDWPEKIENFGEEMIRKQKSFSSSCTQSGISDYVNIFANSEEQKFENDTGKDPFVSISETGIHNEAPDTSSRGFGEDPFVSISETGIHDEAPDTSSHGFGEDPFVSISETGIHDEAPDTSSHGFGAVTFDQSDTDSDGPELDRGAVYDEQDLEFHLHSLGQISPEQALTNTGSWSPRSNSNNIVESASPPLYFTREKSSPDTTDNKTLREDASELDNSPAVRFDDSDGPSSENDEDPISDRIQDSRQLFSEQSERSRLVFEEGTIQSVASPSKNEESLAFGSKQLSISSDDELNSSEEPHWERSQVDVFNADCSEKLGDVKLSADKPALGSKESDIELNDSGSESGPESGKGLNFGTLTGGFRHKGHSHLPFYRNRLDASSAVGKEAVTTSSVTSSTRSSLVERPKIGTTSTAQDLQSESDSDGFNEDEYQKKSFGRKQPLSDGTVKTKLESSNSFFGSHDDSDLDEDSLREPVTRKSHLRSGISRRTKPPSSSMTNSNPKMNMRSEALDSAGIDRTSYGTETSTRRESNRRMSGAQEKHEQQISGGTSVPANSNAWRSAEQPNSSKTSSSTEESKESIKSGVYDSNYNLEKQPSSFYAPDNQEEFEPPSRKSSHSGKFEQQIPVDVAANPAIASSWRTSEKHNSGKATSNTTPEWKISQKSSAVEELGNPQQKSGTDASSGGENSSTSTLDKPKPSLNKNDAKKASHVHPKLPDYDSLVQSLRLNRS